MNTSMFRGVHNDKIRQRIIGGISVDVMDNFVVIGIGSKSMFVAPFPIWTLDLNVAIVNAPNGTNRLAFWMPIFFHTQRPTLAPIFIAVTRNESRVSFDTIGRRGNIRRHLLSATAHTNLDYCSCSSAHNIIH